MGFPSVVRLLLLPAVALVAVAACTPPDGLGTTTSQPVLEETEHRSSTVEPVSITGNLPGNLLSLSPAPGSVFGLDLNVCAEFEVVPDFGGEPWDGPAWIRIGEGEHRPFVIVTTHTADGGVALNMCATVRELLGAEELESPPSDGPLEVGVRFRAPDPDGAMYTHSWTVEFQMTSTPHAPEEVRRVREIYRLLETIDADRHSGDEVMSGYFLDGDVLKIYLYDETYGNVMRGRVEAVLGEKVPPSGVRISSLDTLSAGQCADQWAGKTQEVVHSQSDIPLHGMSGGCRNVWNRVRVMVGTEYAAHRIREALEDTDVPQEAVFIQVSGHPSLDDPSGGVREIESTLEFEPAPRLGESVRFEATWTNVGESTIEFTYSPIVPLKVSVFDVNGGFIWASHGGGPIYAIGATIELAPGEEKRFTYHWGLVDMDGFLVDPGKYVVQAQSDIGSTSDTYTLTIE